MFFFYNNICLGENQLCCCQACTSQNMLRMLLWNWFFFFKYSPWCGKIVQKSTPKPFMCDYIGVAGHLLCYKFHHWFWPVQIDSAVTVSNEPSRAKSRVGRREGGGSQCSSWLWKYKSWGSFSCCFLSDHVASTLQSKKAYVQQHPQVPWSGFDNYNSKHGENISWGKEMTYCSFPQLFPLVFYSLTIRCPWIQKESSIPRCYCLDLKWNPKAGILQA